MRDTVEEGECGKRRGCLLSLSQQRTMGVDATLTEEIYQSNS